MIANPHGFTEMFGIISSPIRPDAILSNLSNLSTYLSNLSIYIVYISTYGEFSFSIFENWVDPLDRDLCGASMGLTHLWWRHHMISPSEFSIASMLSLPTSTRI